MAYDWKKEEDVKEFINNIGIEYRFGCYKENKPEVCHLLGDYLEAIKKDFAKAASVYKFNCCDNNHKKSCLKYGNYALLGRGRDKPDLAEALEYFEKGCTLNEATSCHHAGLVLISPDSDSSIKRDVFIGHDYLIKGCYGGESMACHTLTSMYFAGVPKNVEDYKNFNPNNPEDNKNIELLIKPDMQKAFNYAKRGCELGLTYACANVSLMYKKGDGVEKNLGESRRYLDIAKNLQGVETNTKELKFQQGLRDV